MTSISEREKLKAQFIATKKEYYDKAPTARELQEFDREYIGWAERGRTGSITDKEKKISTDFIPRKKTAISISRPRTEIIETERSDDVYVPIKNITPSKPVAEKKASWWNRGKKKASWWNRGKKKSKNWLYHRKTESKESGRVAWHHFGSAKNKAIGAAGRTSSAATGLGYSLPAPVQIWTLAWQKSSKTMKYLIALVFFLAIFFVPWGIFYYAGWAMAAAVMFLISLIYWVFVNIFNGIASIIISIINGIVRVIMGAVILIVEFIMNVFTRDTHKWVPDPLWASRYSGDPWSYTMFMLHRPGYAVRVPAEYWWQGHVLLEGSLIRYDQLANIPSLMLVEAPPWEPWMYTTLIVKFFEHIPGLNGLANGMFMLNEGIAGGFADFVSTADPLHVIVVGCIPIILVASVLGYVYYSNRHHLRS